MNHQPFRDWLLSDDELPADKAHALQEHLTLCESCRQLENAWAEVDTALQHSPTLSPAPGFTARWQIHLSEYQQSKQKQWVGLSIGISTVMVIALLVVLITQLWSFVQSPGQYLAVWFSSLVSIISIYYAIVDKLNISNIYQPIYTFAAVFFLVGLISFMSVLWLATYKKFSMARRTA